MSSEKPMNVWDRLRFTNWRIPTKLAIVMLAISLIPLLITATISSNTSARAINQQTRISLSRLAFSTAERIEQFLVDNHNFIRMAASEPEVIQFLTTLQEEGPDLPSDSTKDQVLAFLNAVKERHPELQAGIDSVVANLLTSDPAIDLVGFYNLQGFVVSHNNASIVGQSYLFRDYVQSALNNEQFTSGIQIGWTTDTPGINASAPVHAEDEIIGAIATRIQGRFITNILSGTLEIESEDISAEERQAMAIYLVNEYGIVVSHSDNDTSWLYHSLGTITDEAVLEQIASVRLLGGTCPEGMQTCDPSEKQPRTPIPIPAAQPLADELLTAMSLGKSGSFRYCQPDQLDTEIEEGQCPGTWHVVGYAPVQDPFRTDPISHMPRYLFMVVVDMPESVFLRPVDRLRQQGLLIGATMAGLALVASLLLSTTLARPIARLAQAASRVERDEPFEPSDIAEVTAQGDEVGNLARVFSNMVVALRARMAELRTIYEVGRKISESVDLERILNEIADAIGEVIPYDVAEICLYDKRQGKMDCKLSARRTSGGIKKTAGPLYDPNGGYLGYVYNKGESLLVPDTLAFTEVERNPEREWEDVEPRSYLGVPLKEKGEIIGAIELIGAYPNSFNEGNRRVLESIAIQAAIAVQNAREVEARESMLKRQIEQLRIEIDDMKRARQVAEIVESDYFQSLRQKAKLIRGSEADR